MCGKNFEMQLGVSAGMGSPPRVREKLELCRHLAESVGITPACAGKTGNLTQTTDVGQDHPRVCGKNLQTLLSTAGNSGSPPRVREKLDSPRTSIVCTRITPACAGKTMSRSFSIMTSRDHPRVCGKNTKRSQ